MLIDENNYRNKRCKIEDGGSGAFYIYLKKKKMIIWLASYPKSGNTLLRSMLSSYFLLRWIFNFDINEKY